MGTKKLQPLELNGLSLNEIATTCHVSERTARRWKAGTMCPPESALMLLRKDLGAFSPYWKGWTLRGKQIISPDGWEIARDHALALPLVHSQIRTLRQELARAKQALADAGGDTGDWEVEISIGPPGRQRTLRASIRDLNDALLLPKKAKA